MFISNDSDPNAFATGRKTVCITKGMLKYSDEEIKATLAHEFGHLSSKVNRCHIGWYDVDLECP